MTRPRASASSERGKGDLSPLPADPPLERSTLPPRTLTHDPGREDIAVVSALVVLWCRDEPARVGEVLLVRPGGPRVFGRGDASADSRRVGLVRQRPGAVTPGGPLRCPRVSREQLELRASPSGELTISSIGRTPLLHNGAEVERASPVPGDIVELKNELLFFCSRRPVDLPKIQAVYKEPPTAFGEPDASGILGESPLVWTLRARIAAAARLGTHVLVRGPSGSGKELVARAIHRLSSRGQRPLVARNAATIPEGLVDAELFGNLRNYPNPGMPDRPGLVGEADGSTFFLDELGELPAALQARLLRLLDSGEYQRLGESTSRRTDLRLIAATNRPLDAIKHDVLARFSIRLEVPDLNARREDIPLLAAHLLRRHALSNPDIGARFFPDGDTTSPPHLSPALLVALTRHTYTTHVRELDSFLLEAVRESTGKYVDLKPGVLQTTSSRRRPGRAEPTADPLSDEERRWLHLLRKHVFSATSAGRDPEYPGNRQTADLHLRKLLCKALQSAGWSVRGAASFLAGDGDPAMQAKMVGRIETFLENIEKRREDTPRDDTDDPDAALARALAHEWSGSLGLVLDVVRALGRREIH